MIIRLQMSRNIILNFKSVPASLQLWGSQDCVDYTMGKTIWSQTDLTVTREPFGHPPTPVTQRYFERLLKASVTGHYPFTPPIISLSLSIGIIPSLPISNTRRSRTIFKHRNRHSSVLLTDWQLISTKAYLLHGRICNSSWVIKYRLDAINFLFCESCELLLRLFPLWIIITYTWILCF